tara:strand:+ start:5925 stop:6272 length:348 start_codon:yes stop_codon:yes gene_type:complete
MDNTGDYEWFNEKVQTGQSTYDDKKRLFEQVLSEAGINIPSRTKQKLEEILKLSLHNLKANGDEAAHAIAHNFLTSIFPLMRLDEQQYKEHLKKYGQIMQKHGKRCSFKKNYTQE